MEWGIRTVLLARPVRGISWWRIYWFFTCTELQRVSARWWSFLRAKWFFLGDWRKNGGREGRGAVKNKVIGFPPGSLTAVDVSTWSNKSLGNGEMRPGKGVENCWWILDGKWRESTESCEKIKNLLAKLEGILGSTRAAMLLARSSGF